MQDDPLLVRFAARGVEELELLDALLVEIFHAEGDGDSYMAARLHSELGRLGGQRTPLLFSFALFTTLFSSNVAAGCAKLFPLTSVMVSVQE